ncbi:MAG: glycoside hydrolase family 43 protein [Pseudomonadota bacterium]
MLRRLMILISVLLVVGASQALAENPIIQTNFTADPAPLVHDGVVYLYTSHDEDDAEGFKMLDWRLYSSTDMVNWTDHGVVASLATFPWAVQSNDAWAPQVVERHGKFYLYVPISVAGEPKNVIAVAVADSPLGPFKDALGRPLISAGQGNIDPTVAIDRDGQAYLYWGNPHLWYVKLNEDMISYAGDIVQVDAPSDYQEGPWFYRRGGHYYMAYASSCCPEGIGYAMSDSPVGPWIRQGLIMAPSEMSTGNHPGIVDYRGASYVFGFSYRLNFAMTPIHHERRAVSVARLSYNDDGTIPTVPWWNDGGVAQLEPVNPYRRVEAETLSWTSRVRRDRDRVYDWAPGGKTAQDESAAIFLTNILDRDYTKVSGVNFGERGATTFAARVASGSNGGRAELRLDRADGALIGTLTVPNTGGWNEWRTISTPVTGVSGAHDLYIVFHGADGQALFNFDYWQFERHARR